MRRNRVVLAALAALVIMPVQARAQEVRGGIVRVAARGFIGVATEEVPEAVRTAVSRRRAVVDVVAGSPAEKAGVVKGDTILRINGAAATAAVMATPYLPGDTITLRLRRNGRERDVRLVAAERPAAQQFTLDVIPSEVSSRIQIIQDRIHANMDSVRFQGLRIERLGGDSTVIVLGRDTIRTMVLRRGANEFAFDSMVATFRHLPNDSAFLSLRGNVFRFDTVFSGLRARELAPRPMEMVTAFGMRAVAGAELHDLNAELGASFGTARGVLVLNAREGTPAARAGLRGGDVILRANGTDVNSVAELRRAIDSARPGTAVQLRVLRRGQNIDITLGRE